MKKENRLLVVSSHAMDFLWRAGGTIARYAEQGWEIRVIDLTFGEIGESDGVWDSHPGVTAEEVKDIRRKEVERVAEVLNFKPEFLDWGDHLLIIDDTRVKELAGIIKEFNPSVILTQFERDIFNFDHPETANAVLKAIRLARVAGFRPELPRISYPALYMYEPSEPEIVGFNPNYYVDITDTMAKKEEAMESLGTQRGLIESYRTRAAYRGALTGIINRTGKAKYAEAFVRPLPLVTKELPI